MNKPSKNLGVTVLSRLLIVAFGILMAMLMLEVLFRVAYPVLPYVVQAPLREVYVTPFGERKILPPQIVQPDSDYQLVSRAGVVDELQYPVPSVSMRVTTKNWLDANSHVGFRVPSAEWEPRWPVDGVFIGDSFTFCFTEYEACWVRQLEVDYGVSVVNLGQGGTGSISHRNILQKFGLLHEPRFVVWQWYGNDFNEDYGMAVTYLGEPPIADADVDEPQPERAAWQDWLSGHSATYAILDLVLSSQAEQYKHTRFVDPHYFREGELSIAYGREITIAGNDLSQPQNARGMALSLAAVGEAHTILQGEGIPMILLLIPTKEEVYARWTEAELGAETLALIAEGRLEMAAFCEAEGMLCLDMSETLIEAAERGEQIYFEQDNHLNGAGNRLVAAAVWEMLVAQGLMVE